MALSHYRGWRSLNFEERIWVAAIRPRRKPKLEIRKWKLGKAGTDPARRGRPAVKMTRQWEFVVASLQAGAAPFQGAVQST